jgi:phosphotransferase system  glucose/maltose/N-acetylglucosamine-specific IIC component
MSVFSGAFSYLQKIGKCMMLPVSVLPVAGILLGVGSANFPWLPQIVSQIMAQSGGAIFSNLPLLFAIGVAIGLTDNDGVAALASTVGFAVFLATLTAFLTGITEPIEFAFLFVAPVLYVVHALLAGVAYAVCILLGIKHGFTFSHGLIDYVVLFPKSHNRTLALCPRSDLGRPLFRRVQLFNPEVKFADAGARSGRGSRGGTLGGR